MDNDLVEQVARAICAATGLVWELQSDPMTSGSGADDAYGFMEQARAIIPIVLESAAKVPREFPIEGAGSSDEIFRICRRDQEISEAIRKIGEHP